MTNPDAQARAHSRGTKLLPLLLAPVLPFVLSISMAQPSNAASAQQTAIAQAAWFSNTKITFSGDSVSVASDGIPNWTAAKYAKPNAGIVVPTSANDVTLDLVGNLVSAQKLNFTLPLSPAKAASVTSTSLGPIGILVNGAVVFNPYEGDGKTVAVTGNVYLTDSDGVKWGFLDQCNGHPGMGGMYHYHGMPPCVTSVIDKSGGPSHILGIAFDGFLIYGDKDRSGKVIPSSQLDSCNGITSPTPEFPTGVYHYVLTEEKSNRSTINCLTGTPAATKSSGPQSGGPQPGGPQPGGMGAMPGMNGPQQSGGMGAMPGMGSMPGMNGPQQPLTQPSAAPKVSASAEPAASPSPSYTTLYKAVKATQLICQKGKTKKTVISSVCPAGFKKVSSKSVTTFVETKAVVNP